VNAIRKTLRAGFELVERPFDRLFGPSLNPLAQLGALGFFFFWIVAVSGIYLFIFFDTGIERAFLSVEYISRDQWFHAGVMRSFHRYASDLMVVMVAVHMLREFSLDHYRGVRWFSWFTGLPIIWLLYASGITGYWLVWDKLAQYVAVVSSELLDWLPIFGEPIARNFIATGTLTSRFFSLMVFMHVAVPLFLLFIMWVHILRISRPKVNPPRTLALMSLVALLAVSIWKPALSQGPADLAKVPNDSGLDWFYLPLYPLTKLWGDGAVWAFLGAFSLMIALTRPGVSVEAVMIAAKRVLRSMETDKPNVAVMTQAVNDYEALVKSTEKLAAESDAKIGSFFISNAKSYLVTAKQLMRRIRDKVPYSQGDRMMLGSGGGWMVEGSPQRLMRDYNQLVDSYNRGGRV